MYDFLVWLGHGYAAYRAAQDAGMWFFNLDVDQRQEYMEAWLTTKGML